MIDLRFRPFDTWPHKPAVSRQPGPFRVGYLRALDDLEREMKHLGAREITVSTGHKREEIRNDGWPRATAKPPAHPGVILYFQSKHGPLSFACDTYRGWEDNLRAIGLTLQALRAVDRHGATKSGEQYRGYAALPPPPPGDAAQPPRSAKSPQWAAVETLLRAGGYDVTDANVRLLMADPSERKRVYGQAVLRAHPDRGGTDERFIAVRQAWETLR